MTFALRYSAKSSRQIAHFELQTKGVDKEFQVGNNGIGIDQAIGILLKLLLRVRKPGKTGQKKEKRNLPHIAPLSKITQRFSISIVKVVRLLHGTSPSEAGLIKNSYLISYEKTLHPSSV